MKVISAEDDFIPLCPHCGQEIDTILRVEDQKGLLQVNLGHCYACPLCRKILGFADNSSF